MIFHIQQEEKLDEQAFIRGRIVAHALPPELTQEEFERWWPYLTAKEREKYAVYETHNVITLSGRNAILNYVGNDSLSGTGTTGTACTAFTQYFSVGTGAIASVSAGDTTMVGELYRAVPSSATVTGNSVNISTFFSAGVANGTYTNAGIFGNNATGILSTGTLYTHALYSYVKTNANSLTSSYIINLN